MTEQKPIADYLAEFARHGSDTAFVTRRGYRTEHVSYRQIAEAASQFAQELAARQIPKGGRIILWGENSAQWVAVFLGSIQHGAVPVSLDAFASPDFVSRIIQEVNPALLVRSVNLARQSFRVATLEFERLREIVSRHPRAIQPSAAIFADDPLEIIFTSGATAEPRGVVITHGNIHANLAPFRPEIQKYLKVERFFHPIRFLNLVPLSHIFGQFMGVFVPPLLGGEVHFLDTLNPSEILHAIRRERISVLVTAPRLVEALRHKIERDVEAAGLTAQFQQDLEAASKERFLRRWWRFRRLHLRLGWKFWAMVCGGAALDLETETFWSRLGFAVAQGYGLTETASLISVNHPFAAARGSIGKVMPGQEIKLDEHGEILVRGGNIAAAYWRGNQLEPVMGKDGWFHTGDLGEMDSSGRLYFKGRRKRVIVTAEGMNVFPEDLEAALRRQPEVKDCVVAGLARAGNAVPCAALILNGADADAAAAVRRANQRLAPHQQIRHWLIWPDEDFPRTATLKPRLGEIEESIRTQAEMLWKTDGGSGRNWDGPQPFEGTATSIPPWNTTLAALIERVTGRNAPANPAADLATDLNWSSIERVEIMSAIEERYQIELDDGQFTAASTLGEIERLIHAAGSGASAAGRQSPPPSLEESSAQEFTKPATRFTFPRWARRWPVTWLRLALYYLLIWPATLLLGKPRVLGREHLRGVSGPILVVANHVFMIDPGYVLAALPWRFRHRLAIAMDGELIESLRRPSAGFGFFRRMVEKSKYFLITTIFNVFPLPQKSGFRSSFAYTGECVDRGWNVLVFPEGERTRTGRMGPFRAGIGILVNNLGIPVVPMRLTGLYQLKGRRIVPPNAISVRIGPAVSFPPATDPAAITQELEKRVAALD